MPEVKWRLWSVSRRDRQRAGYRALVAARRAVCTTVCNGGLPELLAITTPPRPPGSLAEPRSQSPLRREGGPGPPGIHRATCEEWPRLKVSTPALPQSMPGDRRLVVRRNASHLLADQRPQPPGALPLKLRHPRSAACRCLRSDGTGHSPRVTNASVETELRRGTPAPAPAVLLRRARTPAGRGGPDVRCLSALGEFPGVCRGRLNRAGRRSVRVKEE
jgi:hypothetical protein